MARTRHFRDLLVCGKAMELACEVYAGTEQLPQAGIFGLRMQIRRSLPGVASHIVAGPLTGSETRKSPAAAPGALSEFEFESELANRVGSVEKGLCGEAARPSDKHSRTHRAPCRAYGSPENKATLRCSPASAQRGLLARG